MSKQSLATSDDQGATSRLQALNCLRRLYFDHEAAGVGSSVNFAALLRVNSCRGRCVVPLSLITVRTHSFDGGD